MPQRAKPCVARRELSSSLLQKKAVPAAMQKPLGRQAALAMQADLCREENVLALIDRLTEISQAGGKMEKQDYPLAKVFKIEPGMICRLEYYYFCYYLGPDLLLLGKQSIPSLFLFLLGDGVLFAKFPRLDLNLHCSPGWS